VRSDGATKLWRPAPEQLRFQPLHQRARPDHEVAHLKECPSDQKPQSIRGKAPALPKA
jgi:hypothetical protein